MNNNIITVKDFLENSGLKLAFIDFNRDTDEQAIERLKKSFKELGECHTPLTLIESEKVVNQNFHIYDVETGADVTDKASEYVVVADGQHRLKAAQSLEGWKDLSKLKCFVTDSDIEIAKLIASMNNDLKTWSFGDFVKGAVVVNPNEVITFIQECVEKGFPATTIGQILFQDLSKKLDKNKIAQVMSGSKLEDVMAGKRGGAAEYDLDIARLYVETVEKSELSKIKMKGKGATIGSRYIVEAVAELGKKDGWEKAIEKVGKITKTQADLFKAASSDDKAKKLIEILKTIK